MNGSTGDLIAHELPFVEGFIVDADDGREIGVVDEVARHARTGRVMSIAISSGWFGRRRWNIAPGDVVAVLVNERRVVVSANALPR